MTAFLDLVVGQSESKIDKFVQEKIFDNLYTVGIQENKGDNPVFALNGKLYHRAETKTTGFFSRYFMMRKLKGAFSEVGSIYSDMTSFYKVEDDFDYKKLADGFDLEHYKITVGNILAHVLSIPAVVIYAATRLVKTTYDRPVKSNWGVKSFAKGLFSYILDVVALLATTALSIVDSTLGLVHDVLDVFYVITKPLHYIINRFVGFEKKDAADTEAEDIEALVEVGEAAFKVWAETRYGTVTFGEREIASDVEALGKDKDVTVTVEDDLLVVKAKQAAQVAVGDDEPKQNTEQQAFIDLYNGKSAKVPSFRTIEMQEHMSLFSQNADLNTNTVYKAVSASSS